MLMMMTTMIINDNDMTWHIFAILEEAHYVSVSLSYAVVVVMILSTRIAIFL